MITEDYTEQARAADRAALFQTLVDFEEGGCNGNVEMFMNVLADDVVGVGLGEQGIYHSKKECYELLMSNIRVDTEQTDKKFSPEYYNVDIRIFSPTCAHIYAEVCIKATDQNGVAGSNTFIQMASARKEGDKWLWFAVNAVSMELTKAGIDSMPLKFADKTLETLKAELQTDTFELMNESFSSGILGTYIEENYPLYFANDTLIAMLGYEREEFEKYCKDNTAKLTYADDKAKIFLSPQNTETSVTSNNYDHIRLTKKDGSPIWIDVHTKKTKNDAGQDIFLSVIIDITDIVELQIKADEQNKAIMAGIDYSSKIQANLLPPDTAMANAFTDYSVIWKPRDVVGGDIYWMKKFETGTVLCVADCTGHGTPGALLTMLLVSALNSVVKPDNCHDTAEIIWKIEQRLVDVFSVREDNRNVSIAEIQNGCDLAVLFIANDKNINLSAGHTNVFICDGKASKRIRGQRIYVGEGKLHGKEEIKTVNIPADPENKFYIASDGLFDQNSSKTDEPFGYRTLGDIILEHHSKPLSQISDEIWTAFEEHRGAAPRVDDFELIAFHP